MAFDDIIRQGVALAHSLTTSLQANVVLHRWSQSSGFGEAVYAAPITVTALIEQKQRLHAMSSGQTILTRAKITILTPLAPLGASGRTEPIDVRDKLILPDGTTGPIVDVEGLVDPDTNRPYLYEIWMGLTTSLGR